MSWGVIWCYQVLPTTATWHGSRKTSRVRYLKEICESSYTPWSEQFTPETRPFQKDMSSSNHWFSGAEMLVPGRVHIFTQPKNDGVGLARILEIEMFVLDIKWFLVEWNGTSNENYLIPTEGSVIRETSSMNEWMHGIRATCPPFPHLLYRCSECKGSNWHQQGSLKIEVGDLNYHRLPWDAPPQWAGARFSSVSFKNGHIILVVDEPAFVGARQRLRTEERLPGKGEKGRNKELLETGKPWKT